MEKHLSKQIYTNDGSRSTWLKLHELKANSLKQNPTDQSDDAPFVKEIIC